MSLYPKYAHYSPQWLRKQINMHNQGAKYYAFHDNFDMAEKSLTKIMKYQKLLDASKKPSYLFSK